MEPTSRLPWTAVLPTDPDSTVSQFAAGAIASPMAASFREQKLALGETNPAMAETGELFQSTARQG